MQNHPTNLRPGYAQMQHPTSSPRMMLMRGPAPSQFVNAPAGYNMQPRQLMNPNMSVQSLSPQTTGAQQVYVHNSQQQSTVANQTPSGHPAYSSPPDNTNKLPAMYRVTGQPHQMIIQQQQQQHPANVAARSQSQPQQHPYSPYAGQQQPSTPQRPPSQAATPQQAAGTQSPNFHQPPTSAAAQYQQQAHQQQQVRYISPNQNPELHRQMMQQLHQQQHGALKQQRAPPHMQQQVAMTSQSSVSNTSQLQRQAPNFRSPPDEASGPTDVHYVVHEPSRAHFNGNAIAHDKQQPQMGVYPSMRHPVTQRVVRFTQQPTSQFSPIVRYAYPQQSLAAVTQQQQQHMTLQAVSTTHSEYSPQLVQLVHTDGGGGNSQPAVYYQTAASQEQQQQQHQMPAMRQALAMDNAYRTNVRIEQSSTPQKTLLYARDVPTPETTITIDSQGGDDSLERQSASQSARPAGESSEDATTLAEGSEPHPPPVKKPKPAPSKVARAANTSAKQTKSSKSSKKTVSKPSAAAGRSNGDGALDESDTATPKSVKIVKPSASMIATPIITADLIEQAAKSVNSSLVLEDDVKAGIKMYMDSYVDKLIKETVHATQLRKSTQVLTKDVDFALRTAAAGNSRLS